LAFLVITRHRRYRSVGGVGQIRDHIMRPTACCRASSAGRVDGW
jgi:hypothetical protein